MLPSCGESCGKALYNDCWNLRISQEWPSLLIMPHSNNFVVKGWYRGLVLEWNSKNSIVNLGDLCKEFYMHFCCCIWCISTSAQQINAIYINQIYIETLIHSSIILLFFDRDINIKATGLGILNWLVSTIATWIVGLMDDKIIGLINDQLQQYISEILLLVDPTKFFG